MRVGVYNPYFDTIGGGEKYTAGLVEWLLKRGDQVDIFWQDEALNQKLRTRFDLDIHQASIIPEAYRLIKEPGRWGQKFRWEKRYDRLFFVSDGSIPLMFGKKNVLHFQVPFKGVNGQGRLNRWKLKLVTYVVCNSEFTKSVVDREFKLKSQVIYPPVTPMTPLKKEKLILSVGRFANRLHSKRHDVLIEAFRQLNLPDWKLILAGGVMHNHEELNSVNQAAKDPRIEILTNPDYQTLKKLYGQASIYWHAAGYGQDLWEHPERAEHFGISTVEAMSAQTVPIVYAGGGQKEIIRHGVTGYLWSTLPELTQLTQDLISHDSKRIQIGEQAQVRAKDFNQEVFEHQFNRLIG